MHYSSGPSKLVQQFRPQKVLTLPFLWQYVLTGSPAGCEDGAGRLVHHCTFVLFLIRKVGKVCILIVGMNLLFATKSNCGRVHQLVTREATLTHGAVFRDPASQRNSHGAMSNFVRQF